MPACLLHKRRRREDQTVMGRHILEKPSGNPPSSDVMAPPRATVMRHDRPVPA